jgi:hypothetical protein
MIPPAVGTSLPPILSTTYVGTITLERRIELGDPATFRADTAIK